MEKAVCIEVCILSRQQEKDTPFIDLLENGDYFLFNLDERC